MTTIRAPSRTVVAPRSASPRGLSDAVSRVRGCAGGTPFVATLLLASLAGTLFSSASAQQLTARESAFNSLADSQWVRLKVPHVAGRSEGRLLERTSDHLVLSADPQPLQVPATTIDTLWTRGNAGVTGAIVGGLVLGTLGAALGAAYAGETTENDFTSGQAMLFVGGIGLAGGAVLGGLTGLFIPKWHRQYP
jgi:hypothetical protein